MLLSPTCTFILSHTIVTLSKVFFLLFCSLFSKLCHSVVTTESYYTLETLDVLSHDQFCGRYSPREIYIYPKGVLLFTAIRCDLVDSLDDMKQPRNEAY